MLKLTAEDIRIPKIAREAILRHEKVIVSSHEYPILAILNIDDIGTDNNYDQVGKSFGAILNELKNIPLPDEGYFKELANINVSQEFSPTNPWG